LLVLGICAVFAAPALAITITLDFNPATACGGAPCANSNLIDQGYGDVAGVDVTYTGRDGIGNTAATAASLFYWDTGYTGLTDVAWTNQTDTGEIAFTGAPGTVFTFNSLNLGNYFGAGAETRIYIFDGAYNVLASIDPLNFAPGPFAYAPLGITSSNGLIIQFGPDAFNIGIDDIVVTAEPVPEPASMLLFGLGLGALGLRRRLSR
jgi:hypothetical protein